MQICRTVSEMREFVKEKKSLGKSIALVPTMGYLHNGHAQLMKEALKNCQIVVVSVFLNPIQFGPLEDLERYPKDFEQDCKLLEGLGVQAVFYPTPEEMYGDNFSTYVDVDKLTDCLCGKLRPGHFRGVATVVTKLFNIVQPDQAFFGQKDAQQVLVIRRMVRDLNMPLEINVVPIVREKDGLAISSRNTYLTPNQRSKASILYQGLQLAKALLENGEKKTDKIVEKIREEISKVEEAEIEYIEIRDQNLQEIKIIEDTALLAMAVRFGQTRLIDNIILEV